ncbi:MAG: GYD domain-containing protein [Syntrophobacteraceae bacterium]
MAKYLYYGNFVGDGIKGLLKDGGSGRVAAVKKAFESLGGTVECYYFAFGEYDFFIIVDAPDNVSAASASLTANASGLVTVKTTVLMTPEEMDEVAKKSPTYRGPGQ